MNYFRIRKNQNVLIFFRIRKSYPIFWASDFRKWVNSENPMAHTIFGLRIGKSDKCKSTLTRTICKLFYYVLYFLNRDHDHLTGKYIGPAHNSCNLNKRREKPFLSIFMHNFSGYDSHLILPFLTKKNFPLKSALLDSFQNQEKNLCK